MSDNAGGVGRRGPDNASSTASLSYKERRRLRNPDRKRHGARNQNKTKVFVRWLIETFPRQLRDDDDDDDDDDDGRGCETESTADDAVDERPKPTSRPILDVAGGKGELAARLCACHGREVVVFDPRECDPVACFESVVFRTLPSKWQDRLSERKREDPDFLHRLFGERFVQRVTYFDECTLATSAELAAAVRNCSLMIGMHADGATEAIVDAALEFGKPFVVVPCCVFPNLFPQRRLAVRGSAGDHGRATTVPVRTYEQFCQYLADKDPRFKTSILPFEGRNVAIWWDGT